MLTKDYVNFTSLEQAYLLFPLKREGWCGLEALFPSSESKCDGKYA
jgi:hypothetical protein